MDCAGRGALRAMAALNGVQNRVAVHGRCEPADLGASLREGEKCIVICDVEGYEDVLLDPVRVPALARTPILVELHEFILAGIGRRIRERFSATHRIYEILQTDRSTGDFPWPKSYAGLFPKRYILWAVGEHRPARMSWLWMEPN
jgi:hypothetical protein